MLVHWLDVVCRHQRLQAKYSYILAFCLFNTIRALSDVLILGGVTVMSCRLEALDSSSWTCVLSGFLLFLALYHICLLFSLAFAWLSFADLRVINSIAKARNAFEIVFTTLQFFMTMGALAMFFDPFEALPTVYKYVS